MTSGRWLAAAAIITLAGCDGPEGPQGPAGPPGQDGQPGQYSATDTLGAPCLSPCHTFTGIVQQYRTSTHFAVYVQELGGEEAETWTTPSQPCGNCHAQNAHEVRAQGKALSPGGTVTNVLRGQTNYLDAEKKLKEAGYVGGVHVAQVYCTTCHKLSEDPHTTGKVYTPGKWGFFVPTGAADEAFIEKSEAAGTATGQAAGKWRTGNSCVWCHKARKDVTNYVAAMNQLSSIYWGPHEGPHADVASGKGGYHFDGSTYDAAHPHMGLPNGCVTCHMPHNPNNKNYPDHSFYPQVTVCATANCHAGATSFDVNGTQKQVEKGLAELRTALNAAGYLTRGVMPSQQGEPLTATQLADTLFALDKVRQTKPPIAVDARTAGALWNYLVLARDRSLGVHQPKYVRQLLWDSIQVVKGTPPTFMPARP